MLVEAGKDKNKFDFVGDTPKIGSNIVLIAFFITNLLKK